LYQARLELHGILADGSSCPIRAFFRFLDLKFKWLLLNICYIDQMIHYKSAKIGWFWYFTSRVKKILFSITRLALETCVESPKFKIHNQIF
jgi:hypothetical protein